jgi:hypothetical protein
MLICLIGRILEIIPKVAVDSLRCEDLGKMAMVDLCLTEHEMQNSDNRPQ